MKMSEYKVLLIDDKFGEKSLEAIINLAALHNIEIIGEMYHEKGMQIIEQDHLHQFHAVILDARGYQSEKDLTDTNKGLYHSLNKLKEINNSRLLPWFVYTGAPKNLSNEDFADTITPFQITHKFGRKELVFYTKTLDDMKLIDDLVLEISHSKNNDVIRKNKSFFEACEYIDIPSTDLEIMLNIFKQLDAETSVITTEVMFNHFRKMLEHLFRHAHKLAILHQRCIDDYGKLNISQSVRFISGKNCDILAVKCKKSLMPKILELNLELFLKITNAASHTNQADQQYIVNVDHYQNQIKSSYLFKQLLYILCDMYLWYYAYGKANSNIENNKLLWETNPILEPITGYVQQDDRGKLYVENCLLPNNFHYKLGDYLIIRTYEKSTNIKYAYYAKHAELIKVDNPDSTKI